MTETHNTIDELMNRDPLELSAQDIDEIIAYQRKQRARTEAGVKPEKPTGPKISLDTILTTLKIAPPKVDIGKRRI